MLTELIRQAVLLERLGSDEGRLRSPGDLVARMRSRLADVGITRLAQITGLDNVGLPVWAAIRPNAATLAVCQGKGLTDDAARASAVMEAVEIGAAERCTPQRVASVSELVAAGERCDVLPGRLRQGHAIPTSDEQTGWVKGHDLMAGDSVWVPAAAVRIDSTDSSRTYWQSSDGLASGNLMIEAVLHGLFELIERDAGEFWHLRSDADVHRACVHPSSFDSTRIDALAESIKRAGLHLRIFDITNDVGIASYFATVSPPPDGRETSWVHFDLASGMGCHVDPARAAAAAIVEALQSRLTTISGARDDYSPEIYAQPIQEDILIYPRAEPIQVSTPSEAIRLDQTLEFVLCRLRDVHVDSVIVVPLHDDGVFATAKIIIPKLELPPGARAIPYGDRLRRAAEASL